MGPGTVSQAKMSCSWMTRFVTKRVDDDPARERGAGGGGISGCSESSSGGGSDGGGGWDSENAWRVIRAHHTSTTPPAHRSMFRGKKKDRSVAGAKWRRVEETIFGFYGQKLTSGCAFVPVAQRSRLPPIHLSSTLDTSTESAMATAALSSAAALLLLLDD